MMHRWHDRPGPRSRIWGATVATGFALLFFFMDRPVWWAAVLGALAIALPILPAYIEPRVKGRWARYLTKVLLASIGYILAYLLLKLAFGAPISWGQDGFLLGLWVILCAVIVAADSLFPGRAAPHEES